MEDKESQVMEVVACDYATAKRLLQQNGSDVQAAIMAFLNGSDGLQSTENQVVVPYHQGTPLSGTGWTPPPSAPIGPQLPQPPAYEDWSNLETDRSDATKKTERTSKKRNTPIDLTGDDEDDDLRKAMQASLESESTRQKRQQEYGYDPRSGTRGTNADDEALTRAIEASMQQSTTVTRAQTPQPFTQNLGSLGAYQMRPPECPVAIIPPTPFMRLFASSLQALFAASSFRKALLSLRLSDLRLELQPTASMQLYWQGSSPSGSKGLNELDWATTRISATDDEKEALDGTMRLLTLFIFLTYTKRPLCVAEDVISRPIKGNYAYVMNSSRRPASDIVSCNVQATLDAITLAIDCLNKQEPGSRDDCKNELRSACLSFTATAVTPQSEEPRQLRRPKDPYEVSIHQLIHNNVNTSVHKALFAYLADDKSLYTSTASTLFLSLGRLGVSSLPFGFGMETEVVEDIAPFQVESKLYLDQFMFEKRNGVRLGLDSEEVKNHLARIEELEKHRKTIGWHQGSDSRVLLRGSLKYFESLCNSHGADQMRLESIEEAVPRLTKTLAALEQEIAETDEQISLEKKAVEDERKATMVGFLEGLSNPQLQTNRYDLEAVMMNDDQTAWSYVRHEETSRDHSTLSAWWKICDGQLDRVTEAEVLADRNVVHFLVYSRHAESTEGGANEARKESAVESADSSEDVGSKPNKTIRLDSVLDWWATTPLVECIEADNAAFGSELAQQLRDNHELEKLPSVSGEDDIGTTTAEVAVPLSPLSSGQ